MSGRCDTCGKKVELRLRVEIDYKDYYLCPNCFPYGRR